MRTLLAQNRGFIFFLICFGFFRTAIADWNPIPSGSMRPTLLEGDVVLVNRLAYDFKLPLTEKVLSHISDPQRGDVVTFFSPKDRTRLIKRILALPGDQIEMRDERLYVNGKAAEYSNLEILLEPLDNKHVTEAVRLTEQVAGENHRIQWLSGVKAKSTFAPLTVPDGHYLMLGDNRDNSADSRYFGFVPRHLLIGKAHHIIASADIKGNYLPRVQRFGQAL